MKWVLMIALMCWLNAPGWMFALWAFCFLIDAVVWFARGCD